MANGNTATEPTTLDRGIVVRDGLELHAPDGVATNRISDMEKLPIPVGAEGNDTVMYAVQFAGRDKGFYRATLVKAHETSLANPARQYLFPKIEPGQAREMDPKYWENPERNLIGRGDTVGFYVDFFKEICYVDKRAAAAGNQVHITDIYLWCPLFEVDRPGGEQHSEHATYRGLLDGELQPDNRFAQMNEDEASAGWCPRCYGDNKAGGRVELAAARCEKLNKDAPEQD